MSQSFLLTDVLSSKLTWLTSWSLLFVSSSWYISADNSNLFFDDTNNRLGIWTNTPASTLDVAWKIQQTESAARSWTISTRTAITTFPVPSLRPSSSNSVIALDIMPNGTPSESSGNGYAWIDICDGDILTWSPAMQFARLWITSTGFQIGTNFLNGWVTKPIFFTIAGTQNAYVTTAWDWLLWPWTTANWKLDVRINTTSNDVTHIAITDTTWASWDRKRALAFYSATTEIGSIDAVLATGSGLDVRISPYNAGRVTDAFVFNYQWRFGVWVTSPTALIHTKAWTATAWTAPLKFTAWTNLTTPENGAFEYDGTNLFFTTGWVRTIIV